jgi:hypothetical protein
MDSNFSVKITADISDLQSRLKAVEVELGKFSKSADKASTSMKGMEQNANRGRMVAFAFGQVVRDAGFFSQSFSLGILAISNNIPILIDQISLSVKALAPFAGALSMVGSILTAGLTIWAYSSAATDKAKKSNEDYIETLKGINKANLQGKVDAQADIINLDLLYKASTNVSLAMKERLKAANEIKETYPEQFQNFSAEDIALKKAERGYYNLRDALIKVAEARAAQSILVKNAETRLINEQKIADLEAEQIKNQAELKKQRDAERKGGVISGGTLAGFGDVSAMQRVSAANSKLVETTKELKRLRTENTKLLNDDAALVEKIKNTTADVGIKSITGDFSAQDINTKTDAFQEYSNALKSITANQTTTELEKLNAVLSAQKTLLDSLSKETYPGVANDMKMVGDSMGETKNQIIALEASAKNLKEFNDKLETFKNISENLSKRRLDIYAGVDVTKSQKLKQEIEAVSDAIIAFQTEISKTQDATIIDFLNQQILILKLELAGLKTTFTDALNIEIAAKNAAEWAKYLAQSVGGDLVNAFNEMLTTGKLSFESIGRSLLGMIKKLVAAAMAAAVLSAILSSLFPGGGGTGFKDMFKVISGVNLSGNSIPGASLTTNASGINTSMATSSAMGSSAPVLETRVSGNDLVILLDRASNNRNKYF